MIRFDFRGGESKVEMILALVSSEHCLRLGWGKFLQAEGGSEGAEVKDQAMRIECLNGI